MRNYETHVYDYIEKATGRHVVKAVTEYAGKAVSACAKCDPDDVFDLEFGKKVALKRLDYKIAKKRAATSAQKARDCQAAIDWLRLEIKRMTKAREQAEIMYADRRVEIKNFEAELTELLKIAGAN
jgi:hypothetical protein